MRLAVFAASLLLTFGGAAAAQPLTCASTTPLNESRAAERAQAVLVLSPKSNLQTVLGTATLVHQDGYFLTAAHTLIDYKPSDLVLHDPRTPDGYSSGVDLIQVVYPQHGACPFPPTQQNLCSYRTLEKEVTNQLRSDDKIGRGNLDLAVLKAKKKPLMKPVPLRVSGFATMETRFWGYPANPQLGAGGIDRNQVEASFVSNADGAPLYKATSWGPGLSGSLMVDGSGRGFGLVRKRKDDAGSVRVQTGADLLLAEDANILVVVPLERFAKAGVFGGIPAPQIERTLNVIRNGTYNAFGEVVPASEEALQKIVKDTEWSLFDYLNLALVDQEISKASQATTLKMLLLFTLKLGVEKATCALDAQRDGTVQTLASFLSTPETVAAASNDFTLLSSIRTAASSIDWGATAGSGAEAGQSFASASVAVLAAGIESDSLTTAQKKELAGWLADDANKKVGLWPIWTAQTQPAVLALKADPAPYVWDSVGKWAFTEGDPGSAAFAFTQAKSQLLQARLTSNKTAEIDSFSAIIDDKLRLSISNLRDTSSQVESPGEAPFKVPVSIEDFRSIADPSLIDIAVESRRQ